MNHLCFIVAVVALIFAGHEPRARSEPNDNGNEFAPQALGMRVPVLTTGRERDKYIGRLVAVKGTVLNSKIPSIAGVEVKADDKLRGQLAYAVGILAKWTVTEEELQADRLAGRTTANDGPGVKYVLYFDLAGRLAEARRIPNN